MPAVPDASALIVLGKMERVDLLSSLYGEVWVTPWVWDEAVTKGKLMGARDAGYIEEATGNLLLSTTEVTPDEHRLAGRLVHQAGIGLGEAEVLAVAKARGATAILDDKAARAVGRGLGVAHTGTVGVVYEAFVHGLLARRDLFGLLEDIGRMLWIAPDLLARIMKQAEEADE